MREDSSGNRMDRDRFDRWKKLKFHDPEKILKRFREVDPYFRNYVADTTIRRLRTEPLNLYFQGMQGVLFCYGLQAVEGAKVYLARGEDEDYDIVTAYERDGKMHYTPVRLMELVPENVDPKATLESEIRRLEQYSEGPVVALHINRRMRVDFDQIKIPPLSVAGLWLYGATRTEWFLYGDLMHQPGYYAFFYPRS